MNNYGLNLSTATEQEVFDHVVGHLRQQGKQCKLGPVSESCAYRNAAGEACAAGCLIFDKDYEAAIEAGKKLEQEPWSWIHDKLGLTYGAHIELVSRLQTIHDALEYDSNSDYKNQSLDEWWEWSFEQLANNKGLSYTAI